LQQAWNKHGEQKFVFSVVEECSVDELYVREQFHIDAKKRDYNSMQKVRVFSKEMLAKKLSALRLLAEKRTHCPKGHEYTPENVYYGKRSRSGDKRCKQCNTDRIKLLRARESTEQRERRLAQMREYHMKNRELHNAKMRAYGASKRAQLE
jgi:hypothetical protein